MTAMDALSETQYSYTPYHFGFNNPVFWNDPSGLAPLNTGIDWLDNVWNNSNNESGVTTWTNNGEYFISDAIGGGSSGAVPIDSDVDFGSAVLKHIPFILNKTNFTIWYKPEEGSTAIPLEPGMKTLEKIDGLNVNGVIWKITDNYSSVTVYPGLMDIQYPNVLSWVINMLLGGIIRKSPDSGWDNLFNVK